MAQVSPITIQRMPLRIASDDRLNSYNHHALAPWLAETGYLTPLFLHRRQRALDAFNMARVMSPRLADWMLARPAAVLQLSREQIERLLGVAARTEYGTRVGAGEDTALRAIADELAGALAVEKDDATAPLPDPGPDGFFVRMSHCSPKDADGGDLLPVFSIREALGKIIASRRTVHTLISLCVPPSGCDADIAVDGKIYLFPYVRIDKLSEWRCFVHGGRVVAISQTRFHQHNRNGISDEALQRLVTQARELWDDIQVGLNFDSCALDVYGEVGDPDFRLRLIEINPGGPYLGSGSLLFHWLDDKDILQPSITDTVPSTVVRIVAPNTRVGHKERKLERPEVYQIGRASRIQDELDCLKTRGFGWVLEEQTHRKFMDTPIPGMESGRMFVTRKAALNEFKDLGGIDENSAGGPGDHPRFVKLRKAWLESRQEDG